ncbi:MAG: hypothetical protein L0215_16730 [Gemmataceae bacterium]|nr:hypothetical protein [Gemmataceae bacterium]
MKRGLAIGWTVTCWLMTTPVAAQHWVLSAKSADDLLAAYRYAAPLVGPAAQLEVLEQFLKAKPLAKLGIDATRPLGLYDDLNEKEDFTAVGFIPLTQPKLFLAEVESVLGKAKDLGGGIYLLQSPLLPADGFLRFANEHVFVAGAPARLKTVPIKPAELLPAPARSKLAAFHAHVDRFPPEFRKEFSKTFLDGLAEPLQLPPESFKRAQSGKTWEAILAQMVVRLGNETKGFTVAIDLDAKTDRLRAEAWLTPTPQSALAEKVLRFGQARSRFASLTRDADLGLHAYVPFEPGFGLKLVSDSLLESVDQSVDPREKRSFAASIEPWNRR